MTTQGETGFASETIEVKAAHRFDEDRLEAYLATHLAGFAGPLAVKQFEGGQSNPTYFLATPARNYVLRRKPPGRLVKSAHAVDREYRVLRALNTTAFPVPQALLFCGDESVLGTVFFVMSHVAGFARADVSMPDLAPTSRQALVESYVDTLAALHRLDHEALGLGDYGPPGNYFERQVSRWSRQFEETETEKLPEMHELIDWLKRSIPDQARTTIVHGDYSFHNLLSHPSEPRLASVLDWELSTARRLYLLHAAVVCAAGRAQFWWPRSCCPGCARVRRAARPLLRRDRALHGTRVVLSRLPRLSQRRHPAGHYQTRHRRDGGWRSRGQLFTR